MQIDILKPFFKSIEHYNYDASTQSDLVFICHSVNVFHNWHLIFFASVGEILYWKQSTLKTYTWASKSVSYRFIGIDFMLRAWLLLMSEEEYLTNT